MVRCACLTLKGEQCKKDASGNSVFCVTHQKKCAAKVAKAKAKVAAKAVPVAKAKAKAKVAAKAVPAAKAKAKAKAKVAAPIAKAKAKAIAPPVVLPPLAPVVLPPLAPVAKAKVARVERPKKNIKVGTMDKQRAREVEPPKQKIYMTLQKDTDLMILYKLDPLDLYKMCMMNKSFLDLCKKDPELRDRYAIARVYNVISSIIKKAQTAPKGSMENTIDIGGVDVPDVLQRSTVDMAKSKKGLLAVKLTFGPINNDIPPGLVGHARDNARHREVKRRIRLLEYIQNQVLRPLFLFATQPMLVNYIIASKYGFAYFMSEKDFLENYI